MPAPESSASPELLAGAKHELQAVLQSSTFRQAPKLGNLLLYLCNKALTEEDERVTEYMIAVDVLGKPQDFKDTKDSNVRVEVHRLRKKLAQFYEGEGKDRPLRIIIRPGGYTPEFVPFHSLPTNGASLPEHPAGDQAPEHGTPVSEEETRSVEPGFQHTTTAVAAEAPAERQPVSPPARRMVVWAVVVVVAMIAAAIVLLLTVVPFRKGALTNALTPAKPSGRTAANAPSSAPVFPAPVLPLRILAGYSGPPLSDAAGETWGPDRYFTGGRAYSWGDVRAWRTNKQLLFQHSRIGEVAYEIPLPPGVYELHLYFMEPEYTPEVRRGEGDRTFYLHLNAERLLPAIDIESDAMGAKIADEKVVRDVEPAADGRLHIAFETSLGVPLLNALEILPGTRRRQLPIRIVTGSAPYTDHNGNVWQPDNFYLNGQMCPRDRMVSGTADPGLFTAERYGHFSYAIPVDIRDTYSIALHFAELYFGPAVAGGGGVGSRVFKVMCNGSTLLDNFDVLRLAGSAHELTETFHNIRPTVQGKINLTFEPINNYAMVSAIEVIDDSPL